MNRILLFVPVFALLYLGYMAYERGKPPEMPALVHAPIPAFELEEILIDGYGYSYNYGDGDGNSYGYSERDGGDKDDGGTFSHTDLPDRTVIINAFATWCSTCIIENDALLELSQKHGIPVYGIAFRDKSETVIRTLNKIGNPYTRIGHDPKGAELVKWQLYSTPESWIVDKHGFIRYHHRGFITSSDIQYVFLPIIASIERNEL